MADGASSDEKKHAAVRDWLKGKFAGCQVYDEPDFSRTSHFYRIDEGGAVRHRVFVSKEFFDDHSPEEIGPLLEGWNAAGLIRGAGARRVMVTNYGVSVQPA